MHQNVNVPGRIEQMFLKLSKTEVLMFTHEAILVLVANCSASVTHNVRFRRANQGVPV